MPVASGGSFGGCSERFASAMMKSVRTGASLRIHGPDLRRVTAALGIEPTSEDQIWICTVPPADGAELDAPLSALLAKVELASEAVRELLTDGYSIDFFCYLGSYATEHAAVLGPDLLRRIADLGAGLWLDVYDEEPPPDR